MGLHKIMFMAVGWGARLREERKRLGLTQEAFTHRNTQRSYEQEINSPDLRYVSTVEQSGIDACYVLTGKRKNEGIESDPVAMLQRMWPNLSTENCAALITLGRSLNALSPGSSGSGSVKPD